MGDVLETPLPGQFDDVSEVLNSEDNLKSIDDESDSEDCDDSEDDYYEDDFYNDMEERPMGPNCQRRPQLYSDKRGEEYLRKFAHKINVEGYQVGQNANKDPSVANRIFINHSLEFQQQKRKKDKSDRATVEQVLDARTRMILYKLLSSGKVVSIDGCISTGKEANVYHALAPEDSDGSTSSSFAIKVFKTSILTFKQRDKYVQGEFRFRAAPKTTNPRKMVRLWAEKEYRNLLRIRNTCPLINSPRPHYLKSNVLVMDFIGENGWPCPLLKDVSFEDSETPKNLYREGLLILYRLFTHCKLVHADFSEFNLLVRNNATTNQLELVVIDVSQSVENDHPRCLDFLRADLLHLQEFFGKRWNVPVGEFRSLFEWITSPAQISDEEALENLDSKILANARPFCADDVAQNVFHQSYIPRHMAEVEHYERDFVQLQKNGEEPIYTNLFGLKPNLSVDVEKNENSDKSDQNSESSDGNEDCKAPTGHPQRSKDETPEEKRERKRLVREEKAEKRQNKVKKHVKKRQEKLNHHNSKRK